MDNYNKTVIIFIHLFFSFSFLAHNIAYCQKKNIYEMDLEELMQIRLIKIALLNLPHTHKKGEVMISYHLMKMNMKDHLKGYEEISTSEVLENYMVSPIQMDMSMHMLNLMYAPSDKITLMAMLNYSSNSMDHQMRNGNIFTTESAGFSDSNISFLYTISAMESGRFVGTFSLNIPTGSFEEKGITPMSSPNEVILPYPMQLGSGTWDPGLALTYFAVKNTYGWGVDIRNTFRLMDNEREYRLGNLFNSTAWYSKIWSDEFSSSLSLDYYAVGNIKGADPELNPMMVYTANPNLRAGNSILGGLTLSYRFQKKLYGLRLGLEGKLPIHQNLDGPQLALQNRYKVAITHVFNVLK